jgi:hypothetical protein
LECRAKKWRLEMTTASFLQARTLSRLDSRRPPRIPRSKPRARLVIVTKAAFPVGVVSPTQYGERIRAAALYLNIQQLIPEDRTAQALSDLFGAPLICPASVVAWVRKKGEELRPVYARIGERVAKVKVRHLDGNGVSHCRQAAMAAHNVEPGLHLLSRW